MSSLSALARLHAARAGSAQPLRTRLHYHLSDEPLVLVVLRLSGDAVAPLACMAGTDRYNPVALTVPQPRNRDQRENFYQRLAAVVVPHIRRREATVQQLPATAHRPARQRCADAPQIIVANPATIQQLKRMGRATRFQPPATTPAPPSQVQLLGRWLTFFAERAEHPGSSLLLPMTRLLAAHWATGQSELEDGNLASLLAWIRPPHGMTGAQAARLTQDRIQFPPAGPTTDPLFDRLELLPRMTAYARANANRDQGAVQRTADRIHAVLLTQLQPTWDHVWDGISILHTLQRAPRTVRRWEEDRDRFTSQSQHIADGGHPQPIRDKAVAAARRLARLEQAQNVFDDEQALDDAYVLAERRTTGTAFAGVVVGRDPDRQITSRKGRRLLRPRFTVQTSDPPPLVRDQDLVEWARPNPKALVRVRSVAPDGPDNHLIVLEVVKGTGTVGKPARGVVPEHGQAVSYTPWPSQWGNPEFPTAEQTDALDTRRAARRNRRTRRPRGRPRHHRAGRRPRPRPDSRPQPPTRSLTRSPTRPATMTSPSEPSTAAGDPAAAAEHAVSRILGDLAALTTGGDGRGIVVDAPPGAGKTTLVRRAAHELAAAGEPVMIIAQTNNQIDDLAAGLAADNPSLDLGRISGDDYLSRPSRLSAYANITLTAKINEVRGCGVILGTAAKWARVKDHHRRWAIVDEAYQMRSDALLLVASQFDRGLFVGDPGQLDPFTIADTERWNGLSYDPRQNAVDVLLAHNQRALVEHQLPVSWRLPESAATVISPAFYPYTPFTAGTTRQHRTLAFTTAAIGSPLDATLDRARQTGWALHQLPPRHTQRTDSLAAGAAAGLAARLLARGAAEYCEHHREGSGPGPRGTGPCRCRKAPLTARTTPPPGRAGAAGDSCGCATAGSRQGVNGPTGLARLRTAAPPPLVGQDRTRPCTDRHRSHRCLVRRCARLCARGTACLRSAWSWSGSVVCLPAASAVPRSPPAPTPALALRRAVRRVRARGRRRRPPGRRPRRRVPRRYGPRSAPGGRPRRRRRAPRPSLGPLRPSPEGR